LTASHKLGEVDYLNRRLKTREPIYLHDVHEMTQFVRLARREAAMPAGIDVFAYHKGLRFDRRMPGLLSEAEAVVVEICTDKHYEAAGFALNVNEIHRQLVESTGAAGEAWWTAIDRGVRPADDLVQALEVVLRAKRKLTETHRMMLRELSFRYLTDLDIADALDVLKALLGRPILVVPHVAVRLPNGSMLAERLQHIHKTLEAARRTGLPVLDPKSFVERDGQRRALDNAGTDFHHYARDYMVIVGREIVQGLRSLTSASRTLCGPASSSDTFM
jgi:hypothetical protein